MPRRDTALSVLTRYRFKNMDLELVLDRHLIVREGKAQLFSEEYWQALMLLIEKRPNAVTNDDLRAVLKAAAASVPKQIELIRHALGDRKPYQLIQTERGI